MCIIKKESISVLQLNELLQILLGSHPTFWNLWPQPSARLDYQQPSGLHQFIMCQTIGNMYCNDTHNHIINIFVEDPLNLNKLKQLKIKLVITVSWNLVLISSVFQYCEHLCQISMSIRQYSSIGTPCILHSDSEALWRPSFCFLSPQTLCRLVQSWSSSVCKCRGVLYFDFLYFFSTALYSKLDYNTCVKNDSNQICS